MDKNTQVILSILAKYFYSFGPIQRFLQQGAQMSIGPKLFTSD